MELGPVSPPRARSQRCFRAGVIGPRLRAAVVASGFLLLLGTLAVRPIHAAPFGSAHREDRAAAFAAIPFDRLTPEAKQRIGRVVDRPTLYRRMPETVIDCDPQIYRFLVRYPEVVVNIWQLMGITRVTVDRVGPYTLNAQDGVGTVSKIELVYGDQETHLLY